MRESRHETVRALEIVRVAVVAVTLIALAIPTAAAAQEDEASISLTDTIPDADLAALIETGAGIFNEGSCPICHAVGGRGDGRRGPDLTDAEWLHSDGSYEGIFRTIVWGVKRDEIKAVTPRPFFMSPSGGMSLSGPDRQAVAAYVWSLGHGRRPPLVAAQDDFLELLERGDIDGAMALFERESRGGRESLLFGEGAINRLGYEFLRRGPQRIAIEIFELNTELHPDSWNVWDSLGEAHMVEGNRRRAIELYEKSLELNPDNENAREKLAELRQG